MDSLTAASPRRVPLTSLAHSLPVIPRPISHTIGAAPQAQQAGEAAEQVAAERSALATTARRLTRDVARLENFKRNLLQSLQAEDFEVGRRERSPLGVWRRGVGQGEIVCGVLEGGTVEGSSLVYRGAKRWALRGRGGSQHTSWQPAARAAGWHILVGPWLQIRG